MYSSLGRKRSCGLPQGRLNESDRVPVKPVPRGVRHELRERIAPLGEICGLSVQGDEGIRHELRQLNDCIPKYSGSRRKYNLNYSCAGELSFRINISSTVIRVHCAFVFISCDPLEAQPEPATRSLCHRLIERTAAMHNSCSQFKS